MKNFMKGMDKAGRGLQYARNKFPNVSDAKIKDSTRIYMTSDQGTDARQTV